MNQKSIYDRIMSRQQGNDPRPVNGERAAKPTRNRLKIAVFSILGVAILGGLGYAAMNYAAVRDLVLQPAVAETGEGGPDLANTPFLEHARQAGLQTCSTVFPVLGELLTNGTEYSVQSTWNNEAADDHIVQALVGMDYASEGYSGPAAGVVFAAPNQSTCEGGMVRVAPFSASCTDIPSVLPQGSTLVNNLGPVAVYELGNNGGNALLLPTESSCVVISVASASG